MRLLTGASSRMTPITTAAKATNQAVAFLGPSPSSASTGPRNAKVRAALDPASPPRTISIMAGKASTITISTWT
jgi:hypothetical protein